MKIPFLNQNSSRSYVREADAARDGGHWQKAADLYGEHLSAKGPDFAIMVQQANCLKEAGEYAPALSLYQRAIELKPTDSDVFLQRGHLLKLMNRKIDSIESYKKAFELDQKNADALHELIQSGHVGDMNLADTQEAVTGGTIWLDITDLVDYARGNVSLSGIQRVAANLVSYSRKATLDGYRVVPVVPDYARHAIMAVNPALAEALVRIFDSNRPDRARIDKAIDALWSSRREVNPTRQDIFLVAGAFWIYPHYDAIARLRQNGMRFGLFVHDLIQIRNPEYVHEGASTVFQPKFIEALSVSDFVLTNSEFVASDVRKYMAETLNFSVPVKAVPLATELRERADADAPVSADILDACSEEFVLCVCTIEIRKNHLYLVRIWERLRAKYGDKIPRLIFVGKWGWDIDGLTRHLNKSGCVGDWLFIFNSISDGALEYLYKHCLLTAYVSFAEGFGLPIGESLVYGKPCIASNTTSMPEVGGQFARYVDPFSLEDGYSQFEKVLLDRDDLKAWAAKIKAEFRPKTWNAFCGDFYQEAISNHQALADKPAALHCRLPAGQVIPGGDGAVRKLASRNARIVVFNGARCSGWSYVEEWGVWTVNRRASLEFVSELKPGTDVQLYLQVRCPPGSESTCLVAKAGAVEASLTLTPTDRFVTFGGIVGAGGRIRVDLIAQGRFGPTGDRQVYVGLSALAYCPAKDPLARMETFEKVMLY